jgi:hypothetical protein
VPEIKSVTADGSTAIDNLIGLFIPARFSRSTNASRRCSPQLRHLADSLAKLLLRQSSGCKATPAPPFVHRSWPVVDGARLRANTRFDPELSPIGGQDVASGKCSAGGSTDPLRIFEDAPEHRPGHHGKLAVPANDL